MTTPQLLKKARAYPIFSLEDCHKWFPELSRPALYVRLTRSVAQHHVLRLKRGLYLLNEEPFPQPFAIASRLDPQAIISLETVLNRRGIIPDIPFAITAVTTQKTARYNIGRVGTFLFRHIHPALAFGFRLEMYSPYTARVAESEKALLDLFWFHRSDPDPQAYIDELRLSIGEKFSWTRFKRYTHAYRNIGLSRLAACVMKKYRT
mgnify:CR=1 FL=1